MKALKENGSVIALVFITIAMFVYLVVGTLGWFAFDKVRAVFGLGPLARKKRDTVKIHPAIHGLVMDEDGFVLPPDERVHQAPVLTAVPFGVAAFPSRTRSSLPPLATVTSMSDRRQSYHDVAPSVHAVGDEGFASSICAFPDSAAERDRLRKVRIAAVVDGPLPANVKRLSDFRGKFPKK
jgi:hypothetical protein